MKPIRRIVTVLAGLALVAADVPPASAQSHFEGATGPGSLYVIDVPANWNGDLVLYAHGILPSDAPVEPPASQDAFSLVRAGLMAGGYAVAASSFSSNGWALADAVRRTHQLSGLFGSKVGHPHRTFLMGHSLGALAITKMAERYPGQYDGVLALCGPLGGAIAQAAYAADARVTFDFYFPGLLPGSPFFVPPGTVFDPAQGGLFNVVLAAFLANPVKLAQWASAAKLPFANSTELLNSALYVVGFLVRFTNDLIEPVNGKIPYDNRNTVYQVNVADPLTNALLSAQLNAGVQRFAGDPAALNYFAHNYTPSGDIGIPVVTLHTLRDPGIPFSHELMFAAAVAEAGASSQLLQVPIDRWGHCTMTLQETAAAFGSLVQWVTTGVKP
jgi:pimeloyl-ACP methyl ester carboxylesterase